MLNKDIRPSTIGGIKRYANQLKKASNIPHHEALDIAARAASYSNYAHAVRQLKTSESAQPRNSVFLSAYWYDKNTHQKGRELIEVTLTKVATELIASNEMKHLNPLSWFRFASPDHLVDDFVMYSQEESIKRISKAIRILNFMDATGLRPIAYSSTGIFPKNSPMPDADHTSYWKDPRTDQIIVIDEPYLDPIVDGERAKWAQKANWHLQASKWGGMYAPGDSSMFVATDASKGFDFAALMTVIDRLETPFTEAQWSGHSSPSHEPFFSPLCVTAQDKRRAVAKGTITRDSGKKTIPLKRWNSPQNRRRPNGAMAIASHLEAANLIKAIQQSDAKPIGVNKQLRSIKSDLEDWFFAEYPTNVTNQYDLFYYTEVTLPESLVSQSNSAEGVIELLLLLKEKLGQSYIDCLPLRKLLAKIDRAILMTTKQA